MILNFWQNARLHYGQNQFPKAANFIKCVPNPTVKQRGNQSKILFVSKVRNLPLFGTNFVHSGLGGYSSPPDVLPV